ncbi:MAG: hypothetical protein RSA84_16810, partial [Acinetobacter sp.]
MGKALKESRVALTPTRPAFSAAFIQVVVCWPDKAKQPPDTQSLGVGRRTISMPVKHAEFEAFQVALRI